MCYTQCNTHLTRKKCIFAPPLTFGFYATLLLVFTPPYKTSFHGLLFSKPLLWKAFGTFGCHFCDLRMGLTNALRGVLLFMELDLLTAFSKFATPRVASLLRRIEKSVIRIPKKQLCQILRPPLRPASATGESVVPHQVQFCLGRVGSSAVTKYQKTKKLFSFFGPFALALILCIKKSELSSSKIGRRF